MRYRSSTFSLATLAGVGTVSAALFAPQTALACHTVEMCVEWTVELDDGPIGDYLTEMTTPARGNRVMIIRPVPEPPLGLFLDNEGCVEFETQFAAGHKVIVYNEAVYDQYTHVRAFGSDEEIEDGTVRIWEAHVPVIGDDAGVEVEITIDADRLANLMGVSIAALHQFNSVGAGLPSVVRNLYPHRDGAPNASANYEALRFGEGSMKEKFVVGHEIGHWLVLSGPWPAGGWSTSYGYVPSETMCSPPTEGMDDDLGGHSLRSAEHASGAMVEGFAHFAATVAFNNLAQTTADFRYYKALDETPASQDLIDGMYRVMLPDGPVGGVNRWTQQQCPADFSNTGGDQEISTELDWMRFFWDFVTASHLAGEPSFWDVVELYVHTNEEYPWSGVGPVWPNVVDAMDDLGPPAFATRLEALEPDHELVND